MTCRPFFFVYAQETMAAWFDALVSRFRRRPPARSVDSGHHASGDTFGYSGTSGDSSGWDRGEDSKGPGEAGSFDTGFDDGASGGAGASADFGGDSGGGDSGGGDGGGGGD